MKWIVQNENELAIIVPQIIENMPKSGVVLIEGQMGAGKTTTVRSILSNISNDSFQGSPTFSLVNEYSSKIILTYLELIIHPNYSKLE